MKIKDLVGYQLVKIDDSKIIVSKDNKTYVLSIEEDCGDCCGYNELKTEMFFEENNKDNPTITSVSYDDNEDYDSCKCKITFYGSNKKIATIDSESSSGSGWTYGACVTVKCNDLDIEETITRW